MIRTVEQAEIPDSLSVAVAALKAILQVTGMTPADVISHQRGIAHKALVSIGEST